MTLSFVKSRLASLTGLKRYAAAFGFGVLMTFSLPPVGGFYILLLCVPGLIWLAGSAPSKKEAFITGWSFGAGYFITGLYWISVALFVDIASFWWALPLSVVAGPAALALFYGLIPLLAWRYKAHETAYTLMTVVAWALVEWMRGHIFTGFPWNLPGYTWHTLLPLMQANAAIGIYGLTLLTLLWSIMPALAATAHRRFVSLVMASFVLVAVAGMTRLYLYPTEPFDDYTVRILQPNIQQSLKWSPQDQLVNFQHHLNLTAAPAKLPHPITFVAWPETALTQDMRTSPGIAQAIAGKIPKGSIALLGSLGTDDSGRYYNSVVALDEKAHVVATYDKHHLVPFGEYIPFRRFLDMTPVASGIAMIGDFTPGDGVSTLHIGTLPKPSPLICYEAIFPGATARRDDRPDWLLNVTNDAWYGKTAGPHQHFEISRVRAVEEGLPLVRSANTGISATVDPLGRIVGMKELGDMGVIDTLLPRPLPPTLYARFGDTLFFLMLLLLGIIGETLKAGKRD